MLQFQTWIVRHAENVLSMRLPIICVLRTLQPMSGRAEDKMC